MKNMFMITVAYMAFSFDFIDASDKTNFPAPLLTENRAF
jgi:hypothetical protein